MRIAYVPPSSTCAKAEVLMIENTMKTTHRDTETARNVWIPCLGASVPLCVVIGTLSELTFRISHRMALDPTWTSHVRACSGLPFGTAPANTPSPRRRSFSPDTCLHLVRRGSP